jgi:hypothetical protein
MIVSSYLLKYPIMTFIVSFHSLYDFHKLVRNSIADLLRRRCATNIFRPHALLDSLPDSLFYSYRLGK